MSSKQITGAEIFIECLKKEKVDTIFAYPGGVVLKIFDVLYEQKDIRYILPRHEQGGRGLLLRVRALTANAR